MSKPKEYWIRMGEIAQLIATDHFSDMMKEEYGRVLRIIDGHEPLYRNIFPVDNFDEQAMHLDLVASDLKANLRYWVYGVAEVKSTTNPERVEFSLNGMTPRFLRMAIRRGIPTYLLVVRYPEYPPDDIVTDGGSLRAYRRFRYEVAIENYCAGEFEISKGRIRVLPDDERVALESDAKEEKIPDEDDVLLQRLIDEALDEANGL